MCLHDASYCFLSSRDKPIMCLLENGYIIWVYLTTEIATAIRLCLFVCLSQKMILIRNTVLQQDHLHLAYAHFFKIFFRYHFAGFTQVIHILIEKFKVDYNHHQS